MRAACDLASASKPRRYNIFRSSSETLKRILAREIGRAEQATAVYLRWFAENAGGNDAFVDHARNTNCQ